MILENEWYEVVGKVRGDNDQNHKRRWVRAVKEVCPEEVDRERMWGKVLYYLKDADGWGDWLHNQFQEVPRCPHGRYRAVSGPDQGMSHSICMCCANTFNPQVVFKVLDLPREQFPVGYCSDCAE